MGSKVKPKLWTSVQSRSGFRIGMPRFRRYRVTYRNSCAFTRLFPPPISYDFGPFSIMNGQFGAALNRLANQYGAQMPLQAAAAAEHA